MEKGTIEKLDPSARILLVEDEDDLLYDTEMILEFISLWNTFLTMMSEELY
ncbi:MAG: hypothetical protein ACFFD4_04560 [Candidatus Odinarchaeota archaeon]